MFTQTTLTPTHLRLTDVRDIPVAREALRELIGERITLKTENGELFAEIAASDCQLKLVAGARFGLYLTEPLRVPLPRPESAKSTAKAGD